MRAPFFYGVFMEKVINEYQAMACDIRGALKQIINKIKESADDDEKLLEQINKSDKAVRTLEKLTSLLGKAMKLELTAEEKCQDFKPPEKEELKPEDFEIVLNAAKQFGLLKDGAEDMIEQIISQLHDRQQRGIIGSDEEG